MQRIKQYSSIDKRAISFGKYQKFNKENSEENHFSPLLFEE